MDAAPSLGGEVVATQTIDYDPSRKDDIELYRDQLISVARDMLREKKPDIQEQYLSEFLAGK